MPRKRARNPLKRKHPEYDAPPSTNINVDFKNRKAKKVKITDTADLDDMSGGATPKDFDRVINWQKYAEKDAEISQKEREAEFKRKQELKRRKDESAAEYARRVNEAIPIPKVKGSSMDNEDTSRGRKKKKAAKAKVNNEQDDDDERQSRGGKREKSPDMWAHLETSRPKFGDVVDRPPELKLPTKLLRNVPKASGSLARRDMLETERNRVVESYRRLMEQKRGQPE